jgi:hypothetical protein
MTPVKNSASLKSLRHFLGTARSFLSDLMEQS